jgi:hypothetical protein
MFFTILDVIKEERNVLFSYFFKNLFDDDLVPMNKKNSEKINVKGKWPKII